jgi:hypothetical protein
LVGEPTPNARYRPKADVQVNERRQKINPAEVGRAFLLKRIKRLTHLDGALRLIVEDVLVVM